MYCDSIQALKSGFQMKGCMVLDLKNQASMSNASGIQVSRIRIPTVCAEPSQMLVLTGKAWITNISNL